MVAPDLQGRGLGRMLLEAIQAAAPDDVTGFVLFTGAGSARNLRMYRRNGSQVSRGDPGIRAAPVAADEAPAPLTAPGRRFRGTPRPLANSLLGPVEPRTAPATRRHGCPRATCHRGRAPRPSPLTTPNIQPPSAADLWQSRGDTMTNIIDELTARQPPRRRPRLPRRRHRQGPRQGRRGQPLPHPGLPGRRDPRAGLRRRPHASPSARSPSVSASSAPSRSTPRSSTGSRSSPAVTSAGRSSTTCATCAARLPRSRSAARPERPGPDLHGRRGGAVRLRT